MACFGRRDGRLYAIDLNTGKARWSLNVGAWATAAVVADGTVYAPSDDAQRSAPASDNGRLGDGAVPSLPEFNSQRRPVTCDRSPHSVSGVSGRRPRRGTHIVSAMIQATMAGGATDAPCLLSCSSCQRSRYRRKAEAITKGRVI